MKDLPNPFWALMFMVLGCVLLLAVLFKVNAQTTAVMLGVLTAVATAGSSLVAGAFGYINGHKDGTASATATAGAATATTGNPPQPSDPTQAALGPQKEVK